MTQPWVDDIAGTLKQTAPSQLVAAGSADGIPAAVLTSPDVDIVDSHFYPAPGAVIAAVAAAAVAGGKAFIAGETDPTNSTSTDVLAAADNPNVSGQAFWSLFGHHDTGGFVQHPDGCTVHFPGDTMAMHQHVIAYEGLGLLMGPHRPRVTPAAPATPITPPLIIAVDKQSGVNEVTWRGTDGAYSYIVARSTAGAGGPFSAVGVGLTDNDTPWTDTTEPAPGTATAWYRVTAYEGAGRVLGVSQTVEAGPTLDVATDPLETWNLTSAHSATLLRTPAGDGVVVAPAQGRSGQIAWKQPGLTTFAATFATTDSTQLPVIRSSADGTTWTTVASQVAADGAASTMSAALHSATTFVRLSWSTTQTAPLTQATYSYGQSST
jgi:hypothetical protein